MRFWHLYVKYFALVEDFAAWMLAVLTWLVPPIIIWCLLMQRFIEGEWFWSKKLEERDGK